MAGKSLRRNGGNSRSMKTLAASSCLQLPAKLSVAGLLFLEPLFVVHKHGHIWPIPMLIGPVWADVGNDAIDLS